jgi:outer membrane receptor protein involved in Fe transport
MHGGRQGGSVPSRGDRSRSETRSRHKDKVEAMSLRALLWAAAVACLLVHPSLGQAQSAPPVGGATGRIAGKVFDKGKEPAASAHVTLLGTRQGAQTDEKGAFVIVGVPVGTVQVQVQALGRDKQVKTVQVNAGQTTNVEFTLGGEKITKEFEVIEVRAEKRIDTKSSTSKQNISAEKLKELPVDNIREAVAVKAGVVARGGEIFVRGGRSGEVKFHVDGVEVSDPLLGRSSNIANLSIAGAELVSGGMDAEHGNALSGIVSVTTREGTDRFGGEVRWDTDRYLDPTKTFNNFDRFTAGVGGPTSIKDLTYFATYEGTFEDTYLKTSRTHPRQTLWDFISLGNRQSNLVNTNFKLAYRFSPKHKLTLETINNRTINTPYNHMWSRQGFVKVTYDTLRTRGKPDQYRPKYGTWSYTQVDSTFVPINMPDHVPTTDDRFHGLTAVWTNQVSDKTVWTTRLSSMKFVTITSVGRKEPWEYWIESPEYWDGNTQVGTENNLYFATHGDFPTYSKRNTGTLVVKSDFSTRRWKQHTFRTGSEVRYNRVQNLFISLPNNENNGLPGGVRSDFLNYNPEGAYYVQDRWEYEGLVLNAGLRYDLFTPGEQIPTSDLPSGQRYKQQVSPRLGIAYPISDKDVLSFHYGWTYQTPGRNFVFENRGVSSSVAIRGNPDLEPETNIAYQAAVQHLFSRDVSGQFAVFFKDIYGLLTVRPTRDEYGNQISVWENGDYASARGFEASVTKSFSHKFSGEVNYTYQIATGVASNPNDAQQFINGGRLYLPISEQALDWDQRNTVTVQGVVRDPGRWGFRLLWQYGSGFPFTPTFRNDRKSDPALVNSRRLPSNSILTIDGDKFYRVWGQNVNMFFEARNVLNAKNINNLSFGTFPNPFVGQSGDAYAIYFTETGRAGGAYLQDVNGDNILDWVPLRDPRVFQQGRHVRMGLSVTF